MRLVAKIKVAATLVAAVVLAMAAVAAAEAGAPVYSWQEAQATVLPGGNLAWAPRPVVFEKGASVRYIDFAAGADTQDGLTPQTAWQHHPWDDHATGPARACKGIYTYVFKGGVIYRGAMQAGESGAAGNPIRLTRDPAWGQGAAAIYGSTQIRGGWKPASAAEAPGMPRPEKVWYIDLGKDYDPDPDSAKFSAMWQVNGEKVERLHIAREPNYDLSDPNNPVQNWPVWTGYDPRTGTLTAPVLKGLGDKEMFRGATIWTGTDFLMAANTAHSMAQWVYDPGAGSLSSKELSPRSFGRIPRAQVHFMIENVAQFLDAPGEYFFAVHGPKAGRLFLWPAGGVDPNSARYEVAQIRCPIAIADQHDIVISDLEFRYNDPDDGTPHDYYVGNGSPSPCVRLIGSCANITVQNCKFYHVANAVVASLHPDGTTNRPLRGVMDNIVIRDNDIEHSERGGTIAVLGDSQRTPGAAYGQLQRVQVLRNRVIDTGFRCGYSPWSSIPAIQVELPETCEIAGNIIDTSFGNGIITTGGKSSGSYNVVPLTRILVHHNQMDNTMLGCNDYGGLEHFQGGPAYLYNNITRNCVGNRTLGVELGYSLYLDGGFKCYCFNNIMAGNVKPSQPDYYNNCGYFMVFGFMDQLFNNTIYHFEKSLDGSSGNRSNILGNLMVDCHKEFIGQNRAGDVSMLGGGDTGEMGRTGIPTMSYASNVFQGNPANFGTVAGISRTASYKGAPLVPGKTLQELSANLAAQQCRLASIGWHVAEAPLVDPARMDYRPTANSGARHRGVKYFVPWALARTVGEWNFFKSAANPQVVLGEGFYMTDEYLGRDMYYFIPRNDLAVSACTANDYVPGPLEDWIAGALVFDGHRVASLAHAQMTRNMVYPAGKDGAKNAYDGSKRETLDMGANNFLIEIVLKTDPGHTRGTLVSKLAQSGYKLALAPDGGLRLTLQAGSAGAGIGSSATVNDGQWHHVIVEADRAAGKASFYVDGKAAGEGPLGAIAPDAALSNTADFIVGQEFRGAVDFLRVCRSTLAESRTSIAELYAWEFDGPFLRDFANKVPADGQRDAGAIGR